MGDESLGLHKEEERKYIFPNVEKQEA